MFSWRNKENVSTFGLTYLRLFYHFFPLLVKKISIFLLKKKNDISTFWLKKKISTYLFKKKKYFLIKKATTNIEKKQQKNINMNVSLSMAISAQLNLFQWQNPSMYATSN